MACKLLAIVGSAVATIVMSMAARNCARQSESITSLLLVVPMVFWTFSDTPVSVRLNSRSCWTFPCSSVIVVSVFDIMAFPEERLEKKSGQRQQGDSSCVMDQPTARHPPVAVSASGSPTWEREESRLGGSKMHLAWFLPHLRTRPKCTDISGPLPEKRRFGRLLDRDVAVYEHRVLLTRFEGRIEWVVGAG